MYKLAVKLMGLDVRGSPFSWFVEKWHLLCISGSSELGQIQLSDQNMTAQYKLRTASPFGFQPSFHPFPPPPGSSPFGGTKPPSFGFGGGFGVGGSVFGNTIIHRVLDLVVVLVLQIHNLAIIAQHLVVEVLQLQAQHLLVDTLQLQVRHLVVHVLQLQVRHLVVVVLKAHHLVVLVALVGRLMLTDIPML